MEWLDLAKNARSLWTVWLVLLFAGIAFYALRPRNKKHFEDCSRIPFRNDSEGQSHE
ncbi:MAG: cbb3-type cytochrome c oxidase subunit 3 [Rhodospirillales bacterium]|nr:cbb3-type cytochrome c oxidase subunit 3 [Rhodospirillales bacterium]